MNPPPEDGGPPVATITIPGDEVFSWRWQWLMTGTGVWIAGMRIWAAERGPNPLPGPVKYLACLVGGFGGWAAGWFINLYRMDLHHRRQREAMRRAGIQTDAMAEVHDLRQEWAEGVLRERSLKADSFQTFSESIARAWNSNAPPGTDIWGRKPA